MEKMPVSSGKAGLMIRIGTAWADQDGGLARLHGLCVLRAGFMVLALGMQRPVDQQVRAVCP